MSNLPRPATPGPWAHSNDGWVINGKAPFEDDIGDLRFWVESNAPGQDAAAIAALPDWIERCDRLEALLREMRSLYANLAPHPAIGAGTKIEKLIERIDKELSP